MRRLPPWTTDAAPALLPTILAAALTLAAIGSKSLWGDETYSVALVRSHWGELWHVIDVREANMSLYYLLLKLWTAFGTSETWVRSLSAVFAVAAVVVTYAIGSRLFGRLTGVVAGGLLSVNAFFVHYAQETRGYSLVLFLVALSTYLFLVMVERPDRWAIAAYSLVSAAAVYAHFFALFSIAAHVVMLLSTTRFRDLRKFSLGYAVMGVLILPLVLFMGFRDNGQINWITRPTPRNFLDSVQALTGESRGLLVAYALLVSVALSVGWRERAKGKLRPLVFLSVCVLLPVLGSFLFSYIKPIFLTRYLIVSMPAMVVMVAVGVTRLRPRIVGVVALVGVLALSARTLRYWYQEYPKEDWRKATALVLDRSRNGDGIVFVSSSRRVPFEYYAAREHHDPPVPIFPATPYGHYDLLADRLLVPNPSRVEEAMAHYHRIWVVRGNYPPTNPDGRDSARVERALEQGGSLRLRQVYSGEGAGIVVELYAG